jgi:thioredoxin 1
MEPMASENIVTCTDANLHDLLDSPLPHLVEFWATWSSPSRKMAPVMEALAVEYKGRMSVGKLDVDQNVLTPQRYQVTNVPTLVLFKRGQIEVRVQGALPKDAIEKMIAPHLR